MFSYWPNKVETKVYGTVCLYIYKYFKYFTYILSCITEHEMKIYVFEFYAIISSNSDGYYRDSISRLFLRKQLQVTIS